MNALMYEHNPVETGSALNILSPSELKAVRITSTFETGRAGGFGGLTGNFDGQGLSFGLMNFTIQAGSLIPLLQEFITKYPANYSSAFGKDADRFKEMVFATKPDPQNPKRQVRDVERQMAFVNNEMNAIPRRAPGNKIIEPWKTYFGRLELDPEFQKIQVKAVRNALDRARYWCWYFTLKTERGFAFMFDLVSSHGGAWLNAPKFKERRRILLRKMLADKQAQVGRSTLTELEKLEVIANMIADASGEEWREKVRVRKLWFVRGVGKVHGTLYDIQKDFGITDNAPDFGSNQTEASEFEWDTPAQEFGEFETATSSPKTIARYNTDLNAPYFGGNFNFLYNGGSSEAVLTYNTYLSYTQPFPAAQKQLLVDNLMKAVAVWDRAAEIQVRDAAGNYNDRILLRFKCNLVTNPRNANKRTQVHPRGSRTVFFIDKDRENVMRDLNIFIVSSRNVLVHELGHVWGLLDEYKDRWISMKLSLGHVGAGSPLINDTSSIMNSDYTDAGEFRTRYFQHIGRAILGAFWGLKKYMIPVRLNGKVVAHAVQGRIALRKRDIAGNPPYTTDRQPFNPVFTGIQIAKRS